MTTTAKRPASASRPAAEAPYARSPRRTRATVIAILCLAALVAIVFAIAGGGSSSTAAPTIRADMGEMYITLDHRTVSEGKVKITARNEGKVIHELVILRTDTRASELVTKASGRVSEASSVGEIADVEAGDAITKTFTLEKGHYAIVCNIAGHYAGGMFTDLTVT